MARIRRLVLLETSGNQDYIFATNRLKENIGASELTYRAGTRMVLNAVRELGGPSLPSNPRKLRDRLCAGASAGGIEVMLATSGKAMLLVDDADKARRLVGLVTERALIDAPGLDLCGAISAPFDWETQPLADAVRDVYDRFEQGRGARPSPQARFATLPVVQPCVSSGLPAALIDQTPGGPQAFSRPVHAKRRAARWWLNRLRRSILPPGRATPKNPDDLEQFFGDQAWLAVVHADGNGFGEMFLKFGQYAAPEATYPDVAARNRAYLDKLRRVSVAMEEATEAAFRRACEVFDREIWPDEQGRAVIPTVPLVIGGDDLTAVCVGEYALRFAARFLQAFEEETAGNYRGGILPELARGVFARTRATNRDDTDQPAATGFAACAGIAIVKHHFPFHQAYELAESLLKSAKEVKRQTQANNVSALDFHVLYDASYTDLDAIRKRQRTDGSQTHLYCRPFVVSEPSRIASGPGRDWAGKHHLNDLLTRVDRLQTTDEADNRPLLPSSQAHALREALFRGREVADALMNRIRERYASAFTAQGAAFEDLLEPPGSLFRPCMHRPDEPGFETRLLDALDSIEFWKGQP